MSANIAFPAKYPGKEYKGAHIKLANSSTGRKDLNFMFNDPAVSGIKGRIGPINLAKIIPNIP